MSGATPDRQIIFATSVWHEMSNLVGNGKMGVSRIEYLLAKRKAGALEHSVAVTKPVL